MLKFLIILAASAPAAEARSVPGSGISIRSGAQQAGRRAYLRPPGPKAGTAVQ